MYQFCHPGLWQKNQGPWATLTWCQNSIRMISFMDFKDTVKGHFRLLLENYLERTRKKTTLNFMALFTSTHIHICLNPPFFLKPPLLFLSCFPTWFPMYRYMKLYLINLNSHTNSEYFKIKIGTGISTFHLLLNNVLFITMSIQKLNTKLFILEPLSESVERKTILNRKAERIQEGQI